MKLKYTSLAVLAALASSGSLLANDLSVTTYGKLRLTMQATDDADLDGTELSSNVSHFGIRGKGQVSDGLTAIYKLEWGVDATDNNTGSTDNLISRDQYVALAGGFGEVLLGRKNTPLRASQARVDLFNQLEGDIQTLFNGEVRADNMFMYTSPEFFGGLRIKYATMSIEGTLDGDDVFADIDGDPNTPDVQIGDRSSTDASSLAIEYASDRLFLAYAQDADVSGDGSETTRLTAQYQVLDWTFGALYNNQDYAADPLNGINEAYNEEGYMLSVAYQINDHTLKFQTGESDDLLKRRISSIGWNINMGTQTDLHFFYTTGDTRDNYDASWFGFGIDQSF